MNYSQGVIFIRDLVNTNGRGSHVIGNGLVIHYPGFKHQHDYRLELNQSAPTHIDIVDNIYSLISNGHVTYASMVSFLEDIYINGLNATHTINSTLLSKELIYWITLQEDINYPPPNSGRKMPFRRYFEASLVAARYVNNTLMDVKQRTNIRGKPPTNWILGNTVTRPSFY